MAGDERGQGGRRDSRCPGRVEETPGYPCRRRGLRMKPRQRRLAFSRPTPVNRR
ncbi:unnamed protein product [Ectocarpus sp. 12 AP-2014]